MPIATVRSSCAALDLPAFNERKNSRPAGGCFNRRTPSLDNLIALLYTQEIEFQFFGRLFLNCTRHPFSHARRTLFHSSFSIHSARLSNACRETGRRTAISP